MKLKLIPFVFTAGVLLLALPSGLRAQAPAASPTPAPACNTPGKHGHGHGDINKWLDKHPKVKAKVLAKFDANHNGVIDGDEIAAVQKWREERREKRQANGGGRHKGDKGAASSPTPAPSPAAQ